MRAPPVLLMSLLGSACLGAPTLRIEVTDAGKPLPTSARVVVFLIAESSGLDEKTKPIDGPFWSSEQPLFSAPASSSELIVSDEWDAYPAAWSKVPPGKYRAQAALIARHADSEWQRVGGNAFSDIGVVDFGPAASSPVTLKLSHPTKDEERKPQEGVAWFSAPSKLLSGFRGTPVALRAGVVYPLEYDPKRTYPAVYRVPGFGGNDQAAAHIARERASSEGEARELAKQTFVIVLDPEGPNGHTLFADSANNGPCQRALVEELIPALEKSFPLDPSPRSRLLFGHSSGGWATLWLALTRPETFGATWSLSPDPVDFRRFQNVNIYDDRNFYSDDSVPPKDRTSFRSFNPETGETRNVMTIRREARQEDVLGPSNSSGQQWDSWFAVFGPKDASDAPAALFDPVTGRINHDIAAKYRAYDIGEMVRQDPARYLPLLRNNVRLTVGDADNFFLNEAVKLLRESVVKLEQPPGNTGAAANIRIVHGYDHGTIFQSPEARAIPAEMLEYLRTHNGH